MNIKQAYDVWAHQYDLNQNKTRDLESISLKTTLADFSFNTCLEIGCGTGKNTQWLLSKVNHITAVDFSAEMLQKAKEKISSDKVNFLEADINNDWNFIHKQYDLLIFSLVLEHIENLDEIFKKANIATAPGGYVYIGELHPLKQYSGTKARFETEEGLQVVKCFTHHISDFTQSAKHHGFFLLELNEYFDGDDRSNVPRLLTLLFRKES